MEFQEKKLSKIKKKKKPHYPLNIWGLEVCVYSVSESRPTPCDSTDCEVLCPWDILGKNTGVGYHFLL